jgi:hypothetical protein
MRLGWRRTLCNVGTLSRLETEVRMNIPDRHFTLAGLVAAALMSFAMPITARAEPADKYPFLQTYAYSAKHAGDPDDSRRTIAQNLLEDRLAIDAAISDIGPVEAGWLEREEFRLKTKYGELGIFDHGNPEIASVYQSKAFLTREVKKELRTQIAALHCVLEDAYTEFVCWGYLAESLTGPYCHPA